MFVLSVRYAAGLDNVISENAFDEYIILLVIIVNAERASFCFQIKFCF